MKEVLISIQPKWCEKIANGKKTVEVRKTRPKLELPFKCYIYCTNTQPYIAWAEVFRGNFESEIATIHGYSRKDAEKIWDIFNGKVMGEFVCDKIFDICIEVSKPDDLQGYPFPCTGLTDKEIMQYLGNGKTGYGWHIFNLKLYDSPKDLWAFHNSSVCWLKGCDIPYLYEPPCGVCGKSRLTRPPQSWCYVTGVE